jgi:hypothetical protein
MCKVETGNYCLLSLADPPSATPRVAKIFCSDKNKTPLWGILSFLADRLILKYFLWIEHYSFFVFFSLILFDKLPSQKSHIGKRRQDKTK